MVRVLRTAHFKRYNRSMGKVALRAVGLTKRYGRVVALDGLDLEVGDGEIHAFVGPNGAGKTTTIRILLGLLRKDGGEVSLLGREPWRDAVELHRRLAYVPGDVTLWPSLTGGEIIDLLGSLRGGVDAGRRQVLTQRFDLDTAKKARAYSRGNRQKVALIAALASRTELLLLDEPTAGLDPLMEATFRECVNDERREGRTILLSSHLLAEVEALADRVTIVRNGKTVETGTLAEMRHLTRISVEAELAAPVALDGMPGVHELSVIGTKVRCQVDRGALDEVVGHLHQAGIRALTCRPRPSKSSSCATMHRSGPSPEARDDQLGRHQAARQARLSTGHRHAAGVRLRDRCRAGDHGP